VKQVEIELVARGVIGVPVADSVEVPRDRQRLEE
jgi:hypothetical protein